MKQDVLKEKAVQKVKNPEKADLREIEPKKSKKPKRLRFFLLALVAVGFVFYAAITIINQNVRIAEKKSELSELNKQINVIEIQSQYLEKVQGYTGDDLNDYMEKLAKEELGYISDGERIFINVAGE